MAMLESTAQFYADMGRSLRDRRRKVGVSQGWVASRLGVDRTTVLKWERGRQAVAAHLAVELAALLGMSVAQLLGGPTRAVAVDQWRKTGGA
jgi:DNA-binding XRE family transcriptional regulator